MPDLRKQILWYAALHRIKKDQPVVVAITGTIAKTSTKEAIGTLLKLAYPEQVRVGYGNLNSWPFGVPLAVLGFQIDFFQQKVNSWNWLGILLQGLWRGWFTRLPKYLVLEFGADKPGDIKAIAERIAPTVGVITITGPAHLEAFGSVDKVAEDKGYVAQFCKADGLVFVNSADNYLTQYHQRAKARVINVVCEIEEIAVKFMEAIGREMGIDTKVVAKAKEAFALPNQRLNYKKLSFGVNLLDDSYNASPLSMKAALNLLKKMPGEKVAILGSMKELGKKSSEYHEEIGLYARDHADKVIAVGLEAKDYHGDIWYADTTEAVEKILNGLNDESARSSKDQEVKSILVKGSHSVHMEKIVDKITEQYG